MDWTEKDYVCFLTGIFPHIDISYNMFCWAILIFCDKWPYTAHWDLIYLIVCIVLFWILICYTWCIFGKKNMEQLVRYVSCFFLHNFFLFIVAIRVSRQWLCYIWYRHAQSKKDIKTLGHFLRQFPPAWQC